MGYLKNLYSFLDKNEEALMEQATTMADGRFLEIYAAIIRVRTVQEQVKILKKQYKSLLKDLRRSDQAGIGIMVLARELFAYQEKSIEDTEAAIAAGAATQVDYDKLEDIDFESIQSVSAPAVPLDHPAIIKLNEYKEHLTNLILLEYIKDLLDQAEQPVPQSPVEETQPQQEDTHKKLETEDVAKAIKKGKEKKFNARNIMESMYFLLDNAGASIKKGDHAAIHRFVSDITGKDITVVRDFFPDNHIIEKVSLGSLEVIANRFREIGAKKICDNIEVVVNDLQGDD